MYLPIEPLSDRELTLKSVELIGLCEAWRKRVEDLKSTGSLETFLKQLKREWAIETGLIERLYNWDRGVTEVLIAEGIDASIIAHRTSLDRTKAAHVRELIIDQQNVVEGLFDFVKGEVPLSEHYVRTLHGEFARNQESTEALTIDGKRIDIPLLKGQYKQHANNPRRVDGTMHNYCPPELVQDEMQRLLGWYRQYQEDAVAPELVSAWLHHRFTQIHPFQDGNGRVARALASLDFLRAGMFPLVVTDAARSEYLDALEAADQGRLDHLVKLFSSLQKQRLLTALAIEIDAARAASVAQNDPLVSILIRDIKHHRASQSERLTQKFISNAEALKTKTSERLEALAQNLVQQLPDLNLGYGAKIENSDANNNHWYRKEIIDTARTLGYFANLPVYRSWSSLSIRTAVQTRLVISLHGLGPAPLGLLAVSAFLGSLDTDKANVNASEQFEHTVVCSEVFQCGVSESMQSLDQRFGIWLEETLVIALEQWRRMELMR
jgi:Fic family protein